ncbi:MAG: T9SS type A sorting domain-containing protein [Flavicella sp.]
MKKITFFAVLALFSIKIFSQNSVPIAVNKVQLAFTDTIECDEKRKDTSGEKFLKFKGISSTVVSRDSIIENDTLKRVNTFTQANYSIKDTVPEKYYTFKITIDAPLADKFITTQDQLVVKSEGDDFDLIGAGKGTNVLNHFGGCNSTKGQKIIYAVVKYNKDYVDGTISKLVLDVYSKEAADWHGANNAGAPSILSNKFEFTLTVANTPLSNNTLETYNFNFAPNPVKNSIRLNAQEAIQNVSFYSSLGKNVLNSTLNSNSDTIDISSLKAGVYLMQVTIDSATATYKIVKE